MTTLWIKNPLAVYAPNVADTNGGIVIRNGLICETVASGEKPQSSVDEIFDASNHVLLPGLINTHHHFYQTLTRACPAALNKPLFPWLQSLYKIWEKLDEEMIFVSTQLAAAELLLSGCTTTADHHYIFSQRTGNALDIQVEAVRNIGIRATLARGSMSLGADQGGLPPNSVVQSENTILDDCARTIDTYHDNSFGSMLQIALAPCSPFSVSSELMKSTAELARQKNVRLHTHLAETHDETEFCLKHFGLRPLDYLGSVGWLHHDVWLAHGIHFNAQELQSLGRNKVSVSHCPSSNMALASGQCPALDYIAAGSSVGIGVDGSASNDCSNMIQELRQAFLLQRLQYGAEQVTHETVLNWGTEGGAACLGREDIGSIAVGMCADLALFKLEELRFSGNGDPLAALILCGAHHADAVLVAGDWKVKNGELTSVNLAELINRHQKIAHQLINS